MTFPTQIPDCDSHNPALLNFFFSSDMAFAPLRNSQLSQFLLTFSLTFYQTHNWMSPFIA